MSKKKPFETYGVFGFPLSHTLSPAIHEKAFSCHALQAFYLALEFSPHEFRHVMSSIHESSLKGFNVTVPYKQVVGKYLDRLTPVAKAVGAVNTAYRKGMQWVGTNTDVDGFMTALKEQGKFRPTKGSALILGAGGASRAVLYGLAQTSLKKIWIANRTLAVSKKLALEMRKLFPKSQMEAIPLISETVQKAILESDLIVNTTSVGMKNTDPPLIPARWIPRAKVGLKKKLFYDLIYSPKETKLLKMAKMRGHKILNGKWMLVHQGAAAWGLWTGKKAPIEKMGTAFDLAVEGS